MGGEISLSFGINGIARKGCHWAVELHWGRDRSVVPLWHFFSLNWYYCISFLPSQFKKWWSQLFFWEQVNGSSLPHSKNFSNRIEWNLLWYLYRTNSLASKVSLSTRKVSLNISNMEYRIEIDSWRNAKQTLSLPTPAVVVIYSGLWRLSSSVRYIIGYQATSQRSILRTRGVRDDVLGSMSSFSRYICISAWSRWKTCIFSSSLCAVRFQ